MQIVIFFGFSIIYMHIYLANAESEYRVKVLNDMFTYPGWLDWEKETYMNIIHRWININENFDSIYLLATDIHGRVVNNENIEHKSLQAHQFLSCKYAQVLKEFYEYEMGMNTACWKIDNRFKHLICLRDLRMVLRKSGILVMRMRGSLSCFHQLSPQYPFNKGVFEILEDFKYFSKSKHLFFKKVTAYVKEKMLLTVKRLSLFYSSFCWPIPYKERYGGLSFQAEQVQRMLKIDIPEFVAHDLKRIIVNDIDLFVKYFDKSFGFKYNDGSKITSLMYDPDLIRRVKRMNELLASPGWLALDFLKIILPKYCIITFKDFLTASADNKIVTKVNINEKVQHAYQFLTCKYALTLKRCCDYVNLIWKQYNSSMNLPNSTSHWEKFVTIITKSEPLVSLMQDALSHFYQFSPHIKYNRDVYYILENFNSQLFNETFSSKIMKGNLNIETDIITIIVKSLKQIYKQNCLPQILIHETVFDKNVEVELSSLEKDFIREIDNFIMSNYTSLGFPFITNSKKKRQLIMKEPPLQYKRRKLHE